MANLSSICYAELKASTHFSPVSAICKESTMTRSTTEESTSPVPKGVIPCNRTSERPLGIEFSGDEVREFLHSLHYDWTKPVKRDFELLETISRRFDAEVDSGRLPSGALPSIKRTMLAAAGFAGDMFYTFHPFELKVLVGVYTTVMVDIDDLCERDPEQMIPAIQRFLASWQDKVSTPHHPCIDLLFRVITTDLSKFYGPMAVGNIVHSTIGFLGGCLIESAYPNGVSCPPTASKFPMYLRLKSGVSEVYAHFLFPETMFPEKDYFETYISSIPAITEFTALVNDILSFYKESVVGTYQNTYLMTLSQVLGRSPVDVWRDTCKLQVEQAKDISASLSRKPELREAWESYVKGYCAFHCNQHRRYRLAEIGIEQHAC